MQIDRFAIRPLEALFAVHAKFDGRRVNKISTEPEKGGSTARIRLFGRSFKLPNSRLLRISMGVLLVICGLFGILPILGFWMIPLGLLVLSYEFSAIRWMRRRVAVWYGRREKSH